MKLTVALPLFFLLSYAAPCHAHTPHMACFDNDDDNITCYVEFSDGSSAAGNTIRVENPTGTVLLSGTVDETGEYRFRRPEGKFIVIFDAGPGHIAKEKSATIIPENKVDVLRKLFNYSKFLHKYIGLGFLVYFLIMGLSGVLLNHPDLLHSISVPSLLIPESHGLSQGRRMAIREAIVAGEQVFIAGRSGIWHSVDQGQRFTPLAKGFPISAYDKDTLCLYYDNEHRRLFAGTRRGLFLYSFTSGAWRHIAREMMSGSEIVDITNVGHRLLVFTPERAYSARLDHRDPSFTIIPLVFDQQDRPTHINLSQVLLKLHDGSLFGFGGRLFVDLIGAMLVFLAVSGLLYWFFPFSLNRFIRFRGTATSRHCYHLHLDVGILTCIFLILITLSGILIRPPFLKMIVGVQVPRGALLFEQQDKNWRPRIDKAAYNPRDETLWLATRNGFFTAPGDMTKPFVKVHLHVPTSGMGTNVFTFLSDQDLLIGSFRGLHIWNKAIRKSRSVQLSNSLDRSAFMATAAIIDGGELVSVVDYQRGLIPLTNPPAIKLSDRFADTTMSLWHFLFELHNGRIFRQWLGAYSWVLIPCGGALLLLCLLTGIYDWLWHKQKIKLRKKKPLTFS